MTKTYVAAAALAATCLAAACGGSSTGPSDNNGGSGSGGGGSTTTTTITITANGVSPRDITVPLGSRVTFQNNDSRQHEMNSDPHPAHTDCTALNVGFIAAGTSGTTQNLNTARTCTYHDHNQDQNTSLQGTIRVQ
jgi:plastocyanin